MSQDSSLSLLRYVTCASWAQSHLTCRWPWPPHGLTVRSKRGTCEWETGRGEGGTWPPRGQHCDRSRISQSLVHFSPFPTAYTRASGTGSLRSALCALTPRSAHSNATASGASSASGYRSTQGAQASRPCLPAGLSRQLEAGRAEVEDGSAGAGTGCHMVGPRTRSLIQPHSVIFRVKRTAHLLRG